MFSQFRIVNLLFISSALFVLSCTTSDGVKTDSVSGPTGEDQPSSSSVSGESSVTEISSSSITGTSSVKNVSSSSVKKISSSSVSDTSHIPYFNTQTCAYSASGTTHGSTGTLTCAEENKTYATVVIGTQTWMAENLAWLPSRDGELNDYRYSERYFVYDYVGTSVSDVMAKINYSTYGVLYNYEAATQACPSGWGLPDTSEVSTLKAYVDANNGTKDIGNSLRATTGWTVSSEVVNSDDFGFSALPGGYYISGSFYDIGDCGYWWTNTSSTYFAHIWKIDYLYSHVNVYSEDKEKAYSVRCLKDSL